MQYIGGKSRIAEQIAPILIDQARGGGRLFYQSVLRQLCRRKQNPGLQPCYLQ